MAGREEFGPTLKAQRERQGITLQAIADSTKISVALLAALERNDLARWPKGIFRRAFVREYAAAIGLSPEPIVTEFVRLFPENPSSPALGYTPGELRLTLEIDSRTSRAATRRRVLIGLLEVSSVVLLGAVSASGLETDLWRTSGIIGLIYYPLASLCLERKLRLRWLTQATGSRAFAWPRLLSSTRWLRTMWQRPELSIPRQESESSKVTTPTPELGAASN